MSNEIINEMESLGSLVQKVEDGRVRDGSKVNGATKSDTGVWELNQGWIVEYPANMPLKYAIGNLALRTNSAVARGDLLPNATYPIQPEDTINPYIIGYDEYNYKYPFLIYEEGPLWLARILIPKGIEESTVGYDPALKQFIERNLPITIGEVAEIVTGGKMNKIPLQIVHHFKGNPYQESIAVKPTDPAKVDTEAWADLCNSVKDIGDAVKKVLTERPTGIKRKKFEDIPICQTNHSRIKSFNEI